MSNLYTKKTTPYVIFGWRLSKEWTASIHGKTLVGHRGDFILRDANNFWWVESAAGINSCYTLAHIFQFSALYIFFIKNIRYDFIMPKEMYLAKQKIYFAAGDILFTYASGAAYRVHNRIIQPLVLYPHREPHVTFDPAP